MLGVEVAVTLATACMEPPQGLLWRCQGAGCVVVAGM
jgi:hypothetical protein